MNKKYGVIFLYVLVSILFQNCGGEIDAIKSVEDYESYGEPIPVEYDEIDFEEAQKEMIEENNDVQSSAYYPSWTNKIMYREFLLQSAKSEKCLDIPLTKYGYPRKIHGNWGYSLIHQWNCNVYNANQRITIIPSGYGNTFNMRFHGSEYIQVNTSNWAQVGGWGITGILSEIKIVPVSHNVFMLKEKHSNYCIDLRGGNMANGAIFHMWQCNPSNRNQHFRIRYLNPYSLPLSIY